MKKEADELEKTDEKKAEERVEEQTKAMAAEPAKKDRADMQTVEEHKIEQMDKFTGTPHQEVMKIKDALDLTRDEQWTLKMKKSIINGEKPDGDPSTLAQKEKKKDTKSKKQEDDSDSDDSSSDSDSDDDE